MTNDKWVTTTKRRYRLLQPLVGGNGEQVICECDTREAIVAILEKLLDYETTNVARLSVEVIYAK